MNNDEAVFELKSNPPLETPDYPFEAKGLSTWELNMGCNKCGNKYSIKEDTCGCGEKLTEVMMYRRFKMELLSLYIATGGLLAIVDHLVGNGIKMFSYSTMDECIEDKSLGKQFSFFNLLAESVKLIKLVVGAVILFIAIRAFKGGQ
jgi:hypothetical protein